MSIPRNTSRSTGRARESDAGINRRLPELPWHPRLEDVSADRKKDVDHRNLVKPELRSLRSQVRKIRDEKRDTPAAANQWLKALRAIFSWANEAEETTVHRRSGLKSLNTPRKVIILGRQKRLSNSTSGTRLGHGRGAR